jgi:hypothetical protein
MSQHNLDKHPLLSRVQAIANLAFEVGHPDLSRDLALVILKHMGRDKQKAFLEAMKL